MRGVVLAGPQKGRWVALKYLSTEGYSPDMEVKLLRQLKHPNIVELLEVVEPTKQRPQLVLVTPEADFDLRSYLGRSRGFPAASQGGGRGYQVVCCCGTYSGDAALGWHFLCTRSALCIVIWSKETCCSQSWRQT